jgi:hypothetical protein
MVYLEKTVEDILNKYPILKESEVCNCDNKNLKPFRIKKSIGICCTTCNSAIWTRTKQEDNECMVRLVRTLI